MRHRLSGNDFVALLSGGLDSYVAVKMAAPKMKFRLAITFDYGQRAAKKEIDTAARIASEFKAEHKIIEIGWMRDETRTALVDLQKKIPATDAMRVDAKAAKNAAAVWVPNRNGVFISIAAAFAEARGIGSVITGFNAEEAKTFPDNSEKFIKASNLALSMSTMSGVRLLSPTSKMTKTEIANNFCDLKLDPEKLWCCYFGNSLLCGRCESCARAIRAFKQTPIWKVIKKRFKES